MYTEFFGLSEKPFSILPDPSMVYPSKGHLSAWTLLEYSVENYAGFVVLSGEIGCGKTSMIRRLMERCPENLVIGLINNTHKSFGDLMQWVLMAYDLPYKGKNKADRFDTFREFLIDEYSKDNRVVLIIDEAQNMDVNTLEELRLLSNINADKDQLIQIVLVGQPELLETLKRPELKQLTQRVALHHHVDFLNKEDTEQYVGYRLAKCGATEQIFSSGACDMIHEFTYGTPRLINILCDTAMLFAYAEGKKKIDKYLMSEVIKDKRKSGLFLTPNMI